MAMASVGKRKAERRGCQVKAQILRPGGSDPIDCLILDFSATGARAKLNAEAELPARFQLYIPSRPETKNVILRWCKGLEFGVEYSTGLADEKTFFELIDRVARLEKAGGGSSAGAPPEALDELARRIATMEARLDGAGASEPVDVNADAALERRIGAVAQAAEDFAARSEHVLTARLETLEQRLQAALAPDVAGRLSRLEAAAEAGAFEPAAGAESAGASGLDPRIVARIADIEARLMSAPRAAAGGVDPATLDARIEQADRRTQERVERLERALMARIDGLDTQTISAPAAPAPMRSAEVADLDFRLHQLAARFDELNAIAAPASLGAAAAPDDLARLAERVSDLEMSVMELRLDGPDGGKPAADEDLHRRIVDMEGRHAEIIGTLRNLLALLTATEGRRQAG